MLFTTYFKVKKKTVLECKLVPETQGVVSSNKLSRFFGSKFGRGKTSSVRIQLRPCRCECLADDEWRLCVLFSFMSV